MSDKIRWLVDLVYLEHPKYVQEIYTTIGPYLTEDRAKEVACRRGKELHTISASTRRVVYGPDAIIY